MFMADSPGVRRRLPGRDADRRGAGAGVDHAARRRPGRAARATRGPGCSPSRARVRATPWRPRCGPAPRAARRARRRRRRRIGTRLPVHRLDDLAAAAGPTAIYPTTADSPAFWLYTSGTTGHAQGRDAPARRRSGWSARPTARRCSASAADDRCLSAAKAFFAYGLGNSVLFPLSVGAAAVLEPAPSRPDADRRAGRELRRDAVLRRPDVLRQHAARRPAGRRAGRRAAGRLGRRGAARPRCTSGGPRTSASTSSTASA